MRVSTILLSLVTSLTMTACDKATPAPLQSPAAPTSVAQAAASAAPAKKSALAANIAESAAPVAPPAAAPTADGPPAIGRMLLPAQIRAAAPYGRGDYLVALDYRTEGFGTYGYLYAGDGTWWVIEQDVVVGGPLPDGGAAMQQVTARWGEGERQRHDAVMRGVASAPHGCLEGCVFDVYQNGQWAGRRVEY